MAEVVISPAARQDLLQIGDYIALHLRNRAGAANTLGNIRKSILLLQDFPERGTPLRQPSLRVAYRYLVCGSYMVFYHLAEGAVCVDRVLYGRRDYLSLLFGDELEETE